MASGRPNACADLRGMFAPKSTRAILGHERRRSRSQDALGVCTVDAIDHTSHQPEATRVLHVLTSLSSTEGGVVAAARMAEAQVATGMECTVAATDGDGPSVASALQAAGVRVHRFAAALRHRPPGRRDRERIHGLVAGHGVVHAHGFWEGFLHATLRSAGEGRLRVLSPHGMLTRWSLNQKPLRKRAYLLARGRRTLRGLHAVHFCSGWEERSSLPTADRVDRWRIPLPLATPEPAMQRVQEVGSSPLVVFVGRVVEGKGVHSLIGAFARGAPSNARLRVVGGTESAYAATCQEIAKRSSAANRIEFTGALPPGAVAGQLAAADLFVLPSAHENFGQAAAEAMAAGLCCLLSCGVALREEPGAAEATVLAPEGEQDLGDAIGRWLADDAGRRQMGCAAARWARESLDLGRIGSQWRDHLCALQAQAFPNSVSSP